MIADTLYCICRRPYESDQFMIECDVCKEWFHGTCVNVKEESADDIEFYHCPRCQIMHGPVILKKKRMHQRQNSKLFDTSESKTGSFKFLMELKQRTFPSAENIPLVRMSSYSLSMEYFNKHGFELPILVSDLEALDLRLPPPGFSVSNIESLIGPDVEIDVIDVAMQENCRMSMRQWANYYNDKHKRQRIYNVISLEFSNTRLAEVVSPPSIIHRLSWVDKYWPQHRPDCQGVPVRPNVQRYCLMSVQDSFTDFHIDFGGTCVWYHIFKGEKIFYLIKPTPANLGLYERWLSSSNQSETFFADQVDTCYILPIKQGETILIPTGWIHAVLTPVDSLVFGGNFLSDFNIPTQLKAYEIERRVQTEDKFLYPYFESMHWYAAQHFHGLLTDLNDRGCEVGEKLGAGLKALLAALKSWSSRRDTSGRHEEAPSCRCTPCNPPFLLKDLLRLLKITAPYLSKIGKPAKEQPTKATVDRYRVNYRHTPSNTSIRLRLSGGHISEYQKKEKYEDDDEDDDDDDDHALMVDEGVRGRKHHHQQHQKYSTSAIKPATTKMKGPQHEAVSISDILHVSGFDVKIDNTSQCSMRDAIQGMLTMSQMPPTTAVANHNNNNNNHYNTQLHHNDNNHYNHNNHKGDRNVASGRHKHYSDDIEEELNSCYKDENFVYPSVASSDSEDGGGRKKTQVDEAWNPKGASRSSRKTLSTRSSRMNGVARMEPMEGDERNHKPHAKQQQNHHHDDHTAWSGEAEHLSYKQSLVDTIHDMHNYSSNSHQSKQPSHQLHHDDDVDDDEYGDDDDDDDVDLRPKKKAAVFTPQKRARSRRNPITGRQRLAQKLKLNKDCF